MLSCGIIVNCGVQCSWIIQLLLVHWDIISLVTGLLYYMYNVKRFITLCNVRWDKIHEH